MLSNITTLTGQTIAFDFYMFDNCPCHYGPTYLRQGTLGTGKMVVDANSGWRYYGATVIRSFRDDESQKVFLRERSRRLPPDIQGTAQRNLVIVDAAESLEDLRATPGNRLERLIGARDGQHSIRINDRWRICFRWADGDAHDVEITDYH